MTRCSGFPRCTPTSRAWSTRPGYAGGSDRDSHGNEVDLLVREKGVLTAVEIKSAATFSTDFVKGIERFKALGIKRVTAGAVLYHGEQPFDVRGVRVLNPLHVEDIRETLTEPSKKEKT